MSRVAYSATKDAFIRDVVFNQFIPKMKEGARLNHIGGADSEIRSWESNAPKVRDILDVAGVPSSVVVSFEYKVPNGGRIDCMLYGRGKDNRQNVVHVELKQWSNDSVEELYDTGVFKVDAFTGGAYRSVCHPSQQVMNYQVHLLNFVDKLNKPNTGLEGLAYCYNYDSTKTPKALYADHYRAILDKHRLYSGNEIEALAKKLNVLLCNGSGLEIFNRISKSRICQSKSLLDAAANMFRGVTEFSLLDDQITASETIFAEVRNARHKNGKTVIIVNGGPGTGKTVIALHVLAQMAQHNESRNMFFTTRSKALRESLKERLRSVIMDNGSQANASDMIANIFKFKPYHYKENEIDLLMVDEAHRVEKSANCMNDSYEEQTYLSMAHSLMYCARVCVFFIDDKQAIKPTEIGNSNDIRLAALNYRNAINDYSSSEFYQKLMRERRALERNLATRQSLAEDTTADHSAEISIIDKKIREQRRSLTKLNNINDVSSSIDEDINVVKIDLKSQFRCNGSDNFLDWLDDVLYKPGDEITTRFNDEEYIFDVCNTPEELVRKIREKNNLDSVPKQVARVVAGYCWKWTERPLPNGDLAKDVKIGDWSMPWETNQGRPFGEYRDMYASSADTWAIEPQGINQIGCIFSVQGFELDYIGVILGPDITYDKEHDCLIGVVGKNHAVKSSDSETFTRHIRNAYRVLMSRGRNGCFVYSTDKQVTDFMLRSLGRLEEEAPKEPNVKILDSADYNRLNSLDTSKFIPLYSIRAACGVFEDGEIPEAEGWIDASQHLTHPDSKRYFAVHAKGNSMLPKIEDGDICVFEWYRGGSREGEIVLTECQSFENEYGGKYTIKKYHSEKTITEDGWHHTNIELHPLNHDGYEPIVLECDDDNEYHVIGVLKCVITNE